MSKKLHFQKGKVSVAAIIILSVVALFSLLLVICGSWLGLIGFLPIIILFVIKEGVYIDFEKRMYKSYLSIFGITPAIWKPLPDGTKIGIRKLKLVARRAIGPVVLDSTGGVTTMELYLYMPQPARVVLTTSDDLKDLYQKAQYIHQHLGFEIIVDNRIPEDQYL